MNSAFGPFLVFMLFFFIISKHIKWWIKLVLGIYQVIVFALYSKAYNKIEEAYEKGHQLSLEDYWDARSNLLDSYEFYIHAPFIIFLICSYYLWIDNCKSRNGSFGVMLTILPVGIVYFIITVFMEMLLSYQP